MSRGVTDFGDGGCGSGGCFKTSQGGWSRSVFVLTWNGAIDFLTWHVVTDFGGGGGGGGGCFKNQPGVWGRSVFFSDVEWHRPTPR